MSRTVLLNSVLFFCLRCSASICVFVKRLRSRAVQNLDAHSRCSFAVQAEAGSSLRPRNCDVRDMVKRIAGIAAA